MSSLPFLFLMAYIYMIWLLLLGLYFGDFYNEMRYINLRFTYLLTYLLT